MNQNYGNIMQVYEKNVTVEDPEAAEGWATQKHLVVNLKTAASEEQSQHDFPIDDTLPSLDQIKSWQREGKMVMISVSSVRANSWQHQEKDENGEPMKYPKPGKMYKAGNKTIEISTSITYQSYAIRLATPEEEELTKQAHGRYLLQQQQNQARSIQKQIDKAEKAAEKRKADIIAKRNKVKRIA